MVMEVIATLNVEWWMAKVELAQDDFGIAARA